jgi:CheY-like chemotaxis protein
MTTIQQAHILSIDDEQLIRDLLVQYLGMVGYSVEAIGDAQEALELVENKNYDLLLLDMKMPQMTGRDFYQALANRNPEMASRVVFVTGDIVSNDTREFLGRTGRPALEKPFDLREMNRVITQELSKHTVSP